MHSSTQLCQHVNHIRRTNTDLCATSQNSTPCTFASLNIRLFSFGILAVSDNEGYVNLVRLNTAMINPFIYVPCADMACYMTLPLYIHQNGYTFVRTGFNPTTNVAQYVWEPDRDYHQDA